MGEGLLGGRQGTLRSGGIRIVCIAGRTTKAVGLLIHWETGGGRGAAGWCMDDAVGGRLETGRGSALTVPASVSVGLSL